MKVHPLAIFLGLVIDFVISFIFAPLLLLMLGVSPNDPNLYVWSLVFGLLAVAVGGYVTARKSVDSKFANSAVFGAVGVLIGFTISLFSEMPTWFHIASAISIIPVALLGAYIEDNG